MNVTAGITYATHHMMGKDDTKALEHPSVEPLNAVRYGVIASYGIVRLRCTVSYRIITRYGIVRYG